MNGVYVLVMTLVALNGDPQAANNEVREEFPSYQACEAARASLMQTGAAGGAIQASCVAKQ